jgi:uncharacterized protein YqhQ
MKNSTDNQNQLKKTSIGGQALIEGLIMLGPDKKAMATRSADGKIKLSVSERVPAKGIAKIPFIRGPVRLVSQMAVGITALMKSAELAELEEEKIESPTLSEDGAASGAEADVLADQRETNSHDLIDSSDQSSPEHDVTDLSVIAAKESPATNQADSAAETDTATETDAAAETKEEPGKIEAWFNRHTKVALWGTVAIALGFSVVLFILLPSLLTDGIRALITWQGGAVSQSNFVLSLIEGLIRIVIFILYLWLASRMEEIKRVWMYHGSEHKTIAAYEAGEELTVENVRKYSRFHQRCGTAFMFLVMVVSILVFALVGRHGPIINLLLRLLLLPIVTAISYELVRLAGRFDNPVTRIISMPGLALQRFTTAEPDDSMLEVAIAAIKPVIPADPDSDQW